jgi:hypothetical protein
MNISLFLDFVDTTLVPLSLTHTIQSLFVCWELRIENWEQEIETLWTKLTFWKRDFTTQMKLNCYVDSQILLKWTMIMFEDKTLLNVECWPNLSSMKHTPLWCYSLPINARILCCCSQPTDDWWLHFDYFYLSYVFITTHRNDYSPFSFSGLRLGRWSFCSPIFHLRWIFSLLNSPTFS